MMPRMNGRRAPSSSTRMRSSRAPPEEIDGFSGSAMGSGYRRRALTSLLANSAIFTTFIPLFCAHMRTMCRHGREAHGKSKSENNPQILEENPEIAEFVSPNQYISQGDWVDFRLFSDLSGRKPSVPVRKFGLGREIACVTARCAVGCRHLGIEQDAIGT